MKKDNVIYIRKYINLKNSEKVRNEGIVKMASKLRKKMTKFVKDLLILKFIILQLS